MSLLSLQSVSLTLASKPILDEVSWHIQAGARIALVGRNGAGKSSLLKLLAGLIVPDKGDIHTRTAIHTAYLVQDVPTRSDQAVYHLLTEQLSEKGEAVKAYFEAKFAQDKGKMASAQAQIDEYNAWDLPAQIERVAEHLGLKLNAAIESLSGGEKRRARLGATLLADADILLLDEPTNHLDIHTIEWLENYLLQTSKVIVLVTHDRAFLKRIANTIVEIDRGKLYPYDCDYETYLDRKEALRVSEASANALFDKQLKEEEAWLRQGIKARRTRNEGRVRRLEAMRETLKARHEALGQVKAHTLDVKSSGKKVIEADKISFSRGDKTLIDNFSCTILAGDKIGILGPNGCGKTTLIQLLLGKIAPQSGHIQQGTHLNTAYFDQLRGSLDESQTVMNNVADGTDFIMREGKSVHVATYLKDFLFTADKLRQPVSVLSGGEKNRLLLAKLFSKPINLLIMDEPTNDLDIETLELLENILLNYQGTLILISHDRAFINQVVTSLFVFEPHGKITTCFGDYNDYQRYKAAQVKLSPQTTTKKAPNPNYPLQKELKKLPEVIERLEARIEQIHQAMAAPDFYEQPQAIIARHTSELEALEQKLNDSFLRWEALEQMLKQ